MGVLLLEREMCAVCMHNWVHYQYEVCASTICGQGPNRVGLANISRDSTP